MKGLTLVVLSSVLLLGIVSMPLASASDGGFFGWVKNFFGFENKVQGSPYGFQNSTHRACSLNNTCIILPGNGTNECYTNKDCMPKNETHRACTLKGTCTTVDGPGKNECSIDNDCSIKQNVTGKVFVTSFTIPTPNFVNISVADKYCEQARKNANLTGTYVAWISFSNMTNAKDRVSDIRYIRTDGVKVVDNKADLIDGTLDAQINHDEFGKLVQNSTYTMTGTLKNGVAGNTCNNWKGVNKNSTYYGTLGSSMYKDGPWTNYATGPCSTFFDTEHLYCFQI